MNTETSRGCGAISMAGMQYRDPHRQYPAKNRSKQRSAATIKKSAEGICSSRVYLQTVRLTWNLEKLQGRKEQALECDRDMEPDMGNQTIDS